MKKFGILCLIVTLTASAVAQIPQKMSYQAVIRDASDHLVTGRTVGMRISLLRGSSTGSAVYVETHSPVTNRTVWFPLRSEEVRLSQVYFQQSTGPQVHITLRLKQIRKEELAME